MTARIADKQAVVERERLVRGSASKAPACPDGGFAFQGRPAGLAVAPDGTVLVSDATSRSILRISAGGAPAVVAGPASVPGAAGRRVLNPAGLAVAADGSVFVADTTGHRIWAASPAGSLRLVAGSIYGYRDGPGAEAQFRFPSGVAIGQDGTCYVADTGSDRIRTITPDGLVATLAGSIYDYGDGRGSPAGFRRPEAVAVDVDGTCYVADTGNGALRRIDRSGASTTPLRLYGPHWPVAVARAPDKAVIVAVAELDDLRRPQACLISVGAVG